MDLGIYNMWPFTRLGGLSKFHAMPIFMIQAVKVRKISGMWVKFLFHAVKNSRLPWNLISCRENLPTVKMKINVNIVFKSVLFRCHASLYLPRYECNMYWSVLFDFWFSAKQIKSLKKDTEDRRRWSTTAWFRLCIL